MKKILIVLFIISISACKKKEKLSISTLIISITPSNATLSINETQRFQIFTRSAKSDNPEINPSWSVEPGYLGNISNSKGLSTTFIAISSGIGKIIATEGDVSGLATITVVSTTTQQILEMAFYNDSGLIAKEPDIYVWQEASATFQEQQNDGTPVDSQKFQRVSGNSTWFGCGIVLYKSNPNKAEDLSTYWATGKLKFYIRTNRALTGNEKIKIEIKDVNNITSTQYISNYNWDNNNRNWQEIVIPLKEFTGISFTNVKFPFMITAVDIASSLTFDWDYVRWVSQ